VLEQGVREFYNHGDYDFVVINEALVFRLHDGYESPSEQSFSNYHNNYFLQFNTKVLKKFFDDCVGFMHDGFNSERAVFLLETDYYNLTSTRINALENFDGYIIGWGKEFLEYQDNLQDLEKESFFHLSNDNYLNYIQDSIKLISTPHFVIENEFYYGALENRKSEINVAGTQYYLRKRVLKLLKKNKIKTHKSLSKPILRMLSRLKLHPYGKYVVMKFYNNTFHKVLIESRAVFTDGSRLRWPIRKYFEIPASGAVLFTDKINGFSELGFKDAENCFLVDESTILERLEFLEHNPEKAQQVASRGQKLIEEKHSLQTRSEQIKSCFHKILKGTFKGTYWEGGEFCVK